MAMLLAEVPHFPMPTGLESIPPGLAARAQKLIGNMSCLFLFRTRARLGIRCNRELFAIWEPRPSRIAVWFVAAGVLTAAMVM